MNAQQQIQPRLEELLTNDISFAAPQESPRSGEWPLLDLVPRQPPSDWVWLPKYLASSSPADWLPSVGIGTEVSVTALKAGLLLMHDFVDECHGYSQSIEGQGVHQLGDYWHAILHRREPDYVNAKYWFRQIGQPPTFLDLARFADVRLESCVSSRSLDWRGRLGGPRQWKPLVFVDLCEWLSSANDPDLLQAAREIQRAEMLLLLRQTYQQAIRADVI
jgi:hypothetical protein